MCLNSSAGQRAEQLWDEGGEHWPPVRGAPQHQRQVRRWEQTSQLEKAFKQCGMEIQLEIVNLDISFVFRKQEISEVSFTCLCRADVQQKEP